MQGYMVVFRLPTRTRNAELSKFCQRFYGQDTSSHCGKYRYHRQGILDDIPHRKLIRGVIIVRSDDVDEVVSFLQKYDAEVYTRKIELTDTDQMALGMDDD